MTFCKTILNVVWRYTAFTLKTQERNVPVTELTTIKLETHLVFGQWCSHIEPDGLTL